MNLEMRRQDEYKAREGHDAGKREEKKARGYKRRKEMRIKGEEKERRRRYGSTRMI